MTDTFAGKLLAWYDQNGRHDLPWHQDRNPYRVWMSEIMLQQTQVTTVIPYFQAFMERFPDLQTLASAPVDDVLSHWSGLGYYARARNLHKAAKQVVDEHSGEFPGDQTQLEALTGIGRSTAAAILAQAFEQRATILDGNVKRVLARYHAVPGWPGKTSVLSRLWECAEQHTPDQRARDYTQAMMDLGATVCTRSKPHCQRCPLMPGCQAYSLELTTKLPISKTKKALPHKQTYMILYYRDDTSVMLQQRQPTGLWGGLWSLPECSDNDALAAWLHRHGVEENGQWPALRHTFSHFHLDITPVLVRAADSAQVMDSAGSLWYPLDHSLKLGLAAPVKKLLDRLASHHQ